MAVAPGKCLALFVAVSVLALAPGCSGVAVEADEPDRPLPRSVTRIVVEPDAAWAREDRDALEFLKRLVTKLELRSAARGRGLAFALRPPRAPEGEKAPAPSDAAAPVPDPDAAVWIVRQCDFVPRGSTSERPSPGAEAAPELEHEARVAARELEGDDEEPRRRPAIRAFHFSVRGWIYGPTSAGDPAEGAPISRVSVSGDASYDEAIGSDDRDDWFERAVEKIADGILDHLPQAQSDSEEH